MIPNKKTYWFYALFASLLGLMLVSTVKAELQLHISKTADDGIPILIAPISGGFNRIIEADLKRSGRFTVIDTMKASAFSLFGSKVPLPILKATKAEYIVRGRVSAAGLDVELVSTHNGKRIAAHRIKSLPNKRRVAHQAADKLFQKITRKKGAFDTRLAYVTVIGRHPNSHYTLYVSDADGYNPHEILASDQPIMSPSWAANGTELAYVSFERGKSAIYVQNIFTGRKRLVSNKKGINGAPTWSPDGSRLALTLSHDGNSEIYVLSLHSKALKRITKNPAIDTEPAWSGDGRSLVFTSDRGGAAQLYKVAAQGGRAKRMTFVGNYNSAADIVDNKIALVRRRSGDFRIAIMEMGGAGADIISKGKFDESPALAPNGTMIAYATQKNGRGRLVVVSDNGKSTQELYAPNGSVREPAWSPYLH
ncbi:MAG: Tol-Pal system beta propeller repeat protein TolB [Cocleimonas sp.]|nr:Tol-Pal system beta propeller repeat protein TolB [Cocleimonas sp.]